jgi:hypothetical protein
MPLHVILLELKILNNFKNTLYLVQKFQYFLNEQIHNLVMSLHDLLIDSSYKNCCNKKNL